MLDGVCSTQNTMDASHQIRTKLLEAEFSSIPLYGYLGVLYDVVANIECLLTSDLV